MLLLLLIHVAQKAGISQTLTLLRLVLPLAAAQAMTQPFEPGADRLAKVAHKDSEVSGCPIIEGANAVLDCSVVSNSAAFAGWRLAYVKTWAAFT